MTGPQIVYCAAVVGVSIAVVGCFGWAMIADWRATLRRAQRARTQQDRAAQRYRNREHARALAEWTRRRGTEGRWTEEDDAQLRAHIEGR